MMNLLSSSIYTQKKIWSQYGSLGSTTFNWTTGGCSIISDSNLDFSNLCINPDIWKLMRTEWLRIDWLIFFLQEVTKDVKPKALRLKSLKQRDLTLKEAKTSPSRPPPGRFTENTCSSDIQPPIRSCRGVIHTRALQNAALNVKSLSWYQPNKLNQDQSVS